MCSGGEKINITEDTVQIPGSVPFVRFQTAKIKATVLISYRWQREIQRQQNVAVFQNLII